MEQSYARCVDILIIGAGPCGLGAALELWERNHVDFLLVDEKPSAGGWASSEVTPEGFTFDFGGHVLFPHKHYRRFGEVLESLPIKWASSVPKRGVLLEGRFLPYPAQCNLQRLRPVQLGCAIVSLGAQEIRRLWYGDNGEQMKGDLGSFLDHEFGPYITQLVMAPLNKKQWAHEPEQLSDSWVHHRSGSAVRNVAKGGLRVLLRNFLLQKDQLGWSDTTRVMYPAHGGSNAIWTAITDTLPSEKMMFAVKLNSISVDNKTANLSNGESIKWRNLISTMPIDELLRSVEDRPDWSGYADQFCYARSRLFGFGIKGTLPEKYRGLHSVSIPDLKVPFWKLTFPTTVANGNSPEGCYSLLCEVSEPSTRAAEPEELLCGRVGTHLTTMGLVSEDRVIVSRWQRTVDHGYPVPFIQRDQLLNQLQPALEAAGIFSRGRFGAWRYEVSNQDHAFMQGIEAVCRILYQTPEETFLGR